MNDSPTEPTAPGGRSGRPRGSDQRRADERGTMTIWILGLCVCVLFFGGIGLDLWRVIELRRSLAASADAAATAGATALDEAALRRGDTLLLPGTAEDRAARQLDLAPDAERITSARIDATPTQVDVEVVGRVEFSLLAIFVRDDPVEVHAHATAEPRRSP